MRGHVFHAGVAWSSESGTIDYRSYSREHLVVAESKPAIPASSAPVFRGDPARYNPEELLVAALASCHMLSYLHLCATNGVVVTAYRDAAVGTMRLNADGSGEFVSVTLRPQVTISSGDVDTALRLHERAHQLCFIARSVNFPVTIEAQA